jgi:hypothetical protein
VKRCPTCNRTFDDDTLSFCLEDGTPLARDSAGRADSQETLVSPSPSLARPETRTNLPLTQNYDQLSGKATMNVAQFNAPPAQTFTPPGQRRTWVWVVGILTILLVSIGGIVIAALVIPPMMRGRHDNRPEPSPTRSESTPTPQPTPVASPSTEAWDVPDDEDEVLSQLSKLEEEWTRANVKGDKQALEKILADEYSGGPTSHTKREYIDSLTPDTSIKSWELKDLTVGQDNDRATIHGTLTDETRTGTEVYDFTDVFVWRDHRWQAVSSKNTRVK